MIEITPEILNTFVQELINYKNAYIGLRDVLNLLESFVKECVEVIVIENTPQDEWHIERPLFTVNWQITIAENVDLNIIKVKCNDTDNLTHEGIRQYYLEKVEIADKHRREMRRYIGNMETLKALHFRNPDMTDIRTKYYMSSLEGCYPKYHAIVQRYEHVLTLKHKAIDINATLGI